MGGCCWVRVRVEIALIDTYVCFLAVLKISGVLSSVGTLLDLGGSTLRVYIDEPKGKWAMDFECRLTMICTTGGLGHSVPLRLFNTCSLVWVHGRSNEYLARRLALRSRAEKW
jgi:hypothetical protein